MVRDWPYKIRAHEVIETEVGDVFINQDGILIMKYRDNLDFELSKAKSAIRVCEEIACGHKLLVMVITGQFGNMPKETREFLSSKEIAKHRRAAALVINNLPHRIMAQFIIRTRNNYFPTRVFRNEKEALKWLNEIR